MPQQSSALAVNHVPAHTHWSKEYLNAGQLHRRSLLAQEPERSDLFVARLTLRARRR
ncbi:hypothetical protein [Rhodococcus sp. ACT016]|uniref:hypothetical protein n=1 Tax=Rhodococcus sp. ACT016 TaxID=3134808 RepID=UPI003D289251